MSALSYFFPPNVLKNFVLVAAFWVREGLLEAAVDVTGCLAGTAAGGLDGTASVGPNLTSIGEIDVLRPVPKTPVSGVGSPLGFCGASRLMLRKFST